MPEFKGHYFGNLPPGCYEDDPRAPWNEEDYVDAEVDVKEAKEELLDEVYTLLREAGYDPQYKGLRVKCLGLYVDVSEE